MVLKKEEMIAHRQKVKKIIFIVWGCLFVLSVIADFVWIAQ